MELLSRISRFFRSRDPSPSLVLATAFRHGALLRLRFVDKNRSVHDLGCHIQSIKNSKIFLALVNPQPASLFNEEKCLLHFKISTDVMEKELRITHDPSQNAFLCKTGIMFRDEDQDGMAQVVGIGMPKTLVRREWRLYPRFNVSSGMIPRASITLEPHAGELKGSARTESRSFPARLLNISAGGAKTVLENTDFVDEFLRIDKSRLLLRLSLTIVAGGLLNAWIPCECVSSSYSIKQRRLTLHLRFLQSEDNGTNGVNEGLPFLQHWLNDHAEGR